MTASASERGLRRRRVAMKARSRAIGLAIAIGGTIGITPDAALLRLMDMYGGTTAVISVWRFIFTGLFNITFTAVKQGGLRPLCSGIRSALGPLLLAALFSSVTNIGFVVSLLKVDPAKALLLISLNPLWAALFGWLLLGDVLETRTVVAQVLSLISITLVFMPNFLSFLSSRHSAASGASDEVGNVLPADGGGSASTAASDGDAMDSGPSEWYDLMPLVTGMAIAAFLVYSRYCSMRGISDASMEAAPPLSSAMTAVVAYAMARSQGVTSLFDGLQPLFWPTLGVDSACIAAYNLALVLAPRYLTGAEVALILLGETLFGPVWVYFMFGVVPSGWTLAGGALLLATLTGHEIAGMGGESRAADASPASSLGSLAGAAPRASPQYGRAALAADDDEPEDPSYRYAAA